VGGRALVEVYPRSRAVVFRGSLSLDRIGDDVMKSITYQMLSKIIESEPNVPVINVLEEVEFDKAHIPGTTNVPVESSDFVKRVERLAGGKDKRVVVYCADKSSKASPKAARTLEDAGFTNVLRFESGTQGWRDAGLKVVGNVQAHR
jgi:rhodanese-related sulfurtransferase